jgi:MFS family permease
VVLDEGKPGRLGRRYWQLWGSSGLSNVADGVLQVALPLVAITYTTSPGQIAGVALAGRLPWLLFALQAGAISDRHDRRRVMLTANVGRASLLAVLAVLVALQTGGIVTLYVAAFAIGVCETLYDTSAQSIMPQVVEKDQLSKANGRLYAVELTGQAFIGPPLGGFLMAVGAALALTGSSAAWFFAAGVLFFVKGK